MTLKLLAAALSVAITVPTALAVMPNTPASRASATVTEPAWEVTSGPTSGQKPFPEGTVNAVSWTGKITPGLGPGQAYSICSVRFVCPGGSDETIPPGNYMGGAQGASFTIDIKQSALTGTHCSKELKVCYCWSGNEECVTLTAPYMFNTPTIDYGGLVQLPAYEVELDVKVVDRFGAVNESYYGEVVVCARSEGGGVKLNGTWGQGVVTIEEGVGTISVDASTVPSGGLVLFDLFAQRTDLHRTSIERQ